MDRMTRTQPKSDENNVFYINIFATEQGVVVAACDADILGKTFREGKIKIHVSEDFYKGKISSKDELLTALASCITANLIGKTVVTHAIDAGYIDADSVIMIQGVPHAQLFRF